jgi:hypothetical protein
MIQDFTVKLLAKMRAIEARYPNSKFDWTHFSDDSAITTHRSSGAGYDYLEVQIASNNEITLTGVPKPNNSVATRIGLVKRLLKEERLYVSATDCPDVIEMFEEASSDKDGEGIAWNEHKHVFDWISYVLYMLCMDELEELAAGKPKASATPATVSVAL